MSNYSLRQPFRRASSSNIRLDRLNADMLSKTLDNVHLTGQVEKGAMGQASQETTMALRRVTTSVLAGYLLSALSLSIHPASASDDIQPRELRRNAATLREIGERFANAGRLERARAMEDQANLMLREAEVLDQLRRTTQRIASSEQAGHADAVERFRVAAENLRAHILHLRAEQREIELIAEDKARNREKLRQLSNRADALRDEGRFQDAEEVEEEIQAILRSSAVDPELKRVNALKRQAVQWQLDGRYEDAMLLQGEAERLLDNVKRRFDYRPEVDARVELLARAADLLHVAGEQEAADRVLERTVQIRRESKSTSVQIDESQPAARDEALRQLREDFERLNVRVDELTRAVESLPERHDP
jgi:tetratricopeptide (TPR) repeat protein